MQKSIVSKMANPSMLCSISMLWGIERLNSLQ